MKTHCVLVESACQALIHFSFKVSAKLICLFEILLPSSLLFMKQIAVGQQCAAWDSALSMFYTICL